MEVSNKDMSDPVSKQHRQDIPESWVDRSNLTLEQAEQLLDWLEAHGYKWHELTFQPERGFTVRWFAAQKQKSQE